MRENEERMRSSKYCNFHINRGHLTKECYQLWEEIETLVQKGHLREFVHHEEGSKRKSHERYQRELKRTTRKDSPRGNPGQHEQRSLNYPTGRIVNMIEEGQYGGGSTLARKRHHRDAKTNSKQFELFNIASDKRQTTITFDEADKRGLCFPHEDAIVISAIIANVEVRCILIDSGSSVDVQYYEAYRKLGISDEQMINFTTLLVGFNKEPIRTVGEITLPWTISERPQDVMNLTRFLIVDTPSPNYNVIIGRPTSTLSKP